MLRAIKIRLYPSKEQESKLNKVLGLKPISQCSISELEQELERRKSNF